MKRSSIRLRWVLWFCATLLGMALIIAYCSAYISPTTTWIPAFFGLYYWPLVVVNLLFLFAVLVKRSSVAWVPFVCLLPTLLFVSLFARWGTTEEGKPDGVSIKIASYNVCNFQGYGKRTREETVTKISRFLEQEQVDVVCMQEFFYPDAGKIRHLFPSLPYQCFSQKTKTKSYRGNVIFSRYPIESVGELTFPHTSRTCLYADINVHGCLVRIYNVHLESNNISLTALADRIRKNQQSPDEILQAHLRIREAFLVRAQQVEIIANHLKSTEMPFIFCGDFNDTPISYTYYQLQKGLNDTFRYAGKGFGATFRYLWPALRIDYIFHNQNFTTKIHTTIKVPYSDHYPVITELILL